MDPRLNPYAPGAGTRPPVLAGRDAQLVAFEVLLDRMAAGRVDQSMIVTGLRGVGKTVLLDEFRQRAEARRWATIEWEVEKSGAFAARVSQHVRRALLQLVPKARWNDRVRKAAAVLKSFTLTFNPDGAVTAGFDTEAHSGLGDSGNIGDDLGDLLVAVGEAAKEHATGLVFLLDEIQYLKAVELEALIAALHRCARRALPVTLVGAGLPQMPRLAAEAKSYSERLFRFPTIGALEPATHARDALTIPAAGQDIAWEPTAVDHVVAYTQGYPYFLQEYGKILWDEAPTSPITLDVARQVQPLVEERLDESFFRVRVDRTTDLELRYLCAMAALGPQPHRAGDVARRVGRTTEQSGPIRSRLIDKGLLYTPGHGLAAFTVPQFDRYLMRCHADVLEGDQPGPS